MSTIWIVLVTASFFFFVEQLRPAHDLPRVSNWWIWVLGLNLCQAFVAFIGQVTWDNYLGQLVFTNVSNSPLWLQVLIGYLVITFCYYWWHRARHQIPLLWKTLHQIHHSPKRVEVAMSFYKHPVEILLNGLLSSLILYVLVGVSAKAAALTVLLTGLAELVYHWNVKTPHILGYFFQRPEMHRIHHMSNHHRDNYSDLPIWDMLFGTYNNPGNGPERVGFDSTTDRELFNMLIWRFK